MNRKYRKTTVRWLLALGPLAVFTILVLVLLAKRDALDSGPEVYKISNSEINYLEVDSKNTSNETTLKISESDFKSLPATGNPNFGFNTSDIWLKFDVSSLTLPFHKKILEVKNPLLNNVDLYIKRGDSYQLIQSSGDALAFNSRPTEHRYYQFPLPEVNHGSTTYLLRVNSGGEQLMAPLNIWTSEGLANRDRVDHMLRGSYFGIIFFVLLFNLFVYTIVREKSTLYYVQYNFFLLLLQLSLGGYAFQHIWPEVPYLANVSNPFFASVSIFFLVKFSQSFLSLKNFFPKTNKFFDGIAILLLLNSLLSLIWIPSIFFISVLTVNITALVLNLAIIPVSILVYRKNFKPAKFFLIGFLLLVVTVFGFIATNAGIVQSDFYSDYGLLIGSAAEVVLLSLAIVDRFKQFKDEALVNLRRMNKMQREQNLVLEQKVVERTFEINQKKEEILSSIRYAERIQKNVLPAEEDVKAIFPDSFVLFKPKDIVSGDFYWAGKNDVTGVSSFAAGDCTGHGVPGAMVSILGCNLLNDTVKQFPSAAPHEILTILDERLKAAINSTEEERSGDGMDLAFWILDAASNSLQFAGANSNIAIWRKGEFIILNGTKRPIGLNDISRHAPFSTQRIAIEKNDVIYSWTDGIIDQFGGPNGKKLKTTGLFNILREQAEMRLSDQRIKLNSFIDQWRGDQEQTDDICFAAVKIS